MGYKLTFLIGALLTMSAPTSTAETLEQKWFLGRWSCELGETKLQMTGLVANDAKVQCSNQSCSSQNDLTYQFQANVQGLALKLRVASFTDSNVQIKDDAGTIIDLRQGEGNTGTKLNGVITNADATTSLSCTRPARYQKPKLVPHVEAGFSVLPQWLFGN